jgi:hypothetical protein
MHVPDIARRRLSPGNTTWVLRTTSGKKSSRWSASAIFRISDLAVRRCGLLQDTAHLAKLPRVTTTCADFKCLASTTAMEFMIQEWAVGFLPKCRQYLGRLEFCLFALSALMMCQDSPGEIFTCSTCLTNTLCAQLTFKQLSQRRYPSNLFPVQLNYSVGSLLSSAAFEPIHSLIRRAD